MELDWRCSLAGEEARGSPSSPKRVLLSPSEALGWGERHPFLARPQKRAQPGFPSLDTPVRKKGWALLARLLPALPGPFGATLPGPPPLLPGPPRLSSMNQTAGVSNSVRCPGGKGAKVSARAGEPCVKLGLRALWARPPLPPPWRGSGGPQRARGEQQKEAPLSHPTWMNGAPIWGRGCAPHFPPVNPALQECAPVE